MIFELVKRHWSDVKQARQVPQAWRAGHVTHIPNNLLQCVDVQFIPVLYKKSAEGRGRYAQISSQSEKQHVVIVDIFYSLYV